VSNVPSLVAWNKIDLAPGLDEGDLPESLRALSIVRVSAKNGTGISALLDRIHDLLLGTSVLDDLVLTNARHRLLLEACLARVKRAQEEMDQRPDFPELPTADLHAALRAIHELLGATVDQAVLARVFERFCIGK
jgi:tRNA modification GTPase